MPQMNFIESIITSTKCHWVGKSSAKAKNYHFHIHMHMHGMGSKIKKRGDITLSVRL